MVEDVFGCRLREFAAWHQEQFLLLVQPIIEIVARGEAALGGQFVRSPANDIDC